MTVANAAYAILSDGGGKMRIGEILKLLQDGGKEFRSEKPASVVQTALDRDDRFKKERKGLYKLKDETAPGGAGPGGQATSDGEGGGEDN